MENLEYIEKLLQQQRQLTVATASSSTSPSTSSSPSSTTTATTTTETITTTSATTTTVTLTFTTTIDPTLAKLLQMEQLLSKPQQLHQPLLTTTFPFPEPTRQPIHYHKWTQQQLDDGVRWKEVNNLTWRKAAEQTGIDKQTLYRRWKEQKEGKSHKSIGRPPLIPEVDEKTMRRWAEVCSDAGSPVSTKTFRQVAGDVGKERNVPLGVGEHGVSRGWLKGFLGRTGDDDGNAALTTKRPRRVDTARPRLEQLNAFFDKVRNQYFSKKNRNGMKWNRIWKILNEMNC